MANLYDEKGRPIEQGDILKVFHFVGRNRRRHYMYKQVLDTVMLGKSDPVPYVRIGHLDGKAGSYYHEREDGRVLRGYEIVQSVDANFEERPRVAAQA